VAPWERALGRAPGRVVPVAQMAALGRRWYRGRLAPEWQPRSREASQALLESTGFTGAFWSFTGA
jgi:hypothetical protein